MTTGKVDEGKSVVDEPVEKDGKHPETVTWNQYVGIKESLGRKLDSATLKVTSLEEQLKTAVKPEDHQKLTVELAQVKVDHQKASDELKAIRESSSTEKRNTLKERGVPEEEVKNMSDGELTAAVKVAGFLKPKPDLGGGGGGGGGLKGSPIELATQAYSKSK